MDGPALPHRAPDSPEQRAALDELLVGPGQVDPGTLEAIADATYERAALPVEFPRPVLLAHLAGFGVCAVPTLANGGGAYCNGTVYYRPRPDRRRQGFVVYHELAHGLLERSGLPHVHADVHALALALMAPRATLLPMLRRYPLGGCVRLLVRRNRYAPRVFLRLRVERFLMAAEEA